MTDCRIERIEIVSFGKLKNVALELSAGLNLLCAPNESGKSTVAAFLRFVLYGFSDARKKELSENDKKKYTPWDTHYSEGSVTLLRGEKRYRVTRSCTAGGKETVVTTEAATGREVFAGEIPGVCLLGVSEEVFGRTLFFRQQTVPQGKDEVLAEQLQNLAVSADEQVGSKKAQDRLTKARNELKGRAGSGWIPALEQESVRLDGQLQAAVQERASVDAMREQLARQQALLRDNAASQERVRQETENRARWDALQKAEQIRRLRAERENALLALEEGRNRAGNNEVSELTALLTDHAEWKTALLRRERAREACAQAKRVAPVPAPVEKGHVLTVIGILLAVCGAVGLLLATLLGVTALYIPGGIAAGVGVLLAVYGICRASAQKRLQRQVASEAQSPLDAMLEQETQTVQALEAALLEKLDRVGLSLSEQLPEQLRERIEACRETERLCGAYESASRACAIAEEGVQLAELEALASGATQPTRTREAMEQEENFLRKQSQMLSQKQTELSNGIARLEGRAADPAVLAGKREAVERMLADCRKRYDAYSLAITGIMEASDRMKATVAPRLSERASAYFAAATDGKYGRLRADTRLALSFWEDGQEREWDYLSAGTRDSAYLSLRLALAELLFDRAGMPFVLDDAFGRLDDARLTAMLRILREASERQQILLLCCTDREKELLIRENVPFCTLTLAGKD